KGPATGLRLPWGLVVDTVHNEVIVANEGVEIGPVPPSITVYSRTANGNVAPLRTIKGSATGLSGPSGLALDILHNELGVPNAIPNSITVYSRTAHGNVAPLRTLSGTGTGLNDPSGVAVDTVHDELFVANVAGFGPGFITVYSRTAHGNAAPLRSLSGDATR